MSKLNFVVLAGVLLLAAAAFAQRRPPGFQIVQLTDNEIREAGPRINDRGTIVYEARLDGTVESAELFLFDNSTRQTVRLTNDRVRDAFPDISDDGTIVWTRFIGPPDRFGPTGEIMIRTPEGQITRLTENDRTDWAPEINRLNHVVWYKEMGDACGLTVDIFMYDGANVFPITTDGIRDRVANQTPALNDSDQVVWTKFDFCVDPWESEIWMYDSGRMTRLTIDQIAPRAPDINNRAVVAWAHRPPRSIVDAIELWDKGVTTELTDWGSGPRLNDSGDVAFIRWHDETGNWQQWLYGEETFWQLSDDPFWNFSGDINSRVEVAWVSGLGMDADIRYLRRISFMLLTPVLYRDP